jgi:hypothetical protein
MFRLAFVSTLLVISITNLWALNCTECQGDGPDGDKKDCWEGQDGLDTGKPLHTLGLGARAGARARARDHVRILIPRGY